LNTLAAKQPLGDRQQVGAWVESVRDTGRQDRQDVRGAFAADVLARRASCDDYAELSIIVVMRSSRLCGGPWLRSSRIRGTAKRVLRIITSGPGRPGGHCSG
jgi:hypothetical protein